MSRQALLNLVAAIGSREAALRRDECGDWRIKGSHGHVYAVPGSLDRPGTKGFQIFVGRESARGWSAVKTAMLPWAEITNDGDDEGAFFIDRLPDESEAAIVRRYVGLRKRRQDSEDTLAAVRERTGKHRFQPKRTGSEEI